MEGETCQYDMFGYCKFQDKCIRTHFSSECEDRDGCKNIKSCQKRHTKKCKKYSSTGCRYEKSCAYKHQMPTPSNDHKLLNEKVFVLEKVVHEMTQKVFSMEKEIEQLKNKNSISEVIEGPDRIKVHKKVQNQISENSCKNDVDKDLFDPKKGKKKRDMIKESDSKEKFFNCTKCKYKCKKELLVKKHMINNKKNISVKNVEKIFLHRLNYYFIMQNTTTKKCKKCDEEYETPIKLSSHEAIDHNEEDEILNMISETTFQ